MRSKRRSLLTTFRRAELTDGETSSEQRAPEAAAVEFTEGNDGGPGVRLTEKPKRETRTIYVAQAILEAWCALAVLGRQSLLGSAEKRSSESTTA